MKAKGEKSRTSTLTEVYNIRHKLDIIQLDFAKLMGVSVSTVSLWERGHRKLPLRHLKTLYKLAKKEKIYTDSFESFVDLF